MSFDRKEDFRSSFKEDRKSNEAPKEVSEIRRSSARHAVRFFCGYLIVFAKVFGDFSDFFKALLGRIGFSLGLNTSL